MREKIKEFFKVIENNKFFHPYPFTDETIEKIMNSDKDLYSFFLDNGKIIGYFMLRGFDEGYEIPSFGMIVHPDYRGKGIGKMMLKKAIEICKKSKCKKIRLTIDKDNKIAKSIYIKAGFKFNKNIGFKIL